MNKTSININHSLLLSRESFPAVVLVLLHAFIWIVVPTLLLGNLHHDTLEAAFWGREFALGYPKHPPLTTWLIDLAVRIGDHPILYLMIQAQVTVVITAYFIWKTVHKFASAQSATLAVAIYMVSAIANSLAVQIDHNTFLAPLYAATLYFGLQYLEDKKWKDSIALGIAVGLGAITKYEIAIPVLVLFLLVATIPRYRSALHKPASYISILIAMAIIFPHIIWLYENDWSCITYALGNKISNLFHLWKSIKNYFTGLFKYFYAPLLFVIIYIKNKDTNFSEKKANQKYIGASLILLPIVGLFIASLVTGQIFNDWWLRPLTVSACMGVVLLFPLKENISLNFQTKLIICSTALSSLFLLGYIPNKFSSDATFHYSVDSKHLSQSIEKLWSDNSADPLKCIVTSEETIGPSAVLWIKTHPKFVNYSVESWSTNSQVNSCAKTGGIAVIVGGDDKIKRKIMSKMTKACSHSMVHMELGTVYNLSSKTWHVDLVYFAPQAQIEDSNFSAEKYQQSSRCFLKPVDPLISYWRRIDMDNCSVL